ncbi:MAG: metallophosphoesterase [Akkermansiaceae bacterium]|nr:metallophosphoesterase [Armatimonadota bacterium]
MKAATPNPARRKLILRLLSRGGASVLGGLWAYSGLWEPNRPRVEAVTIPLPDLPASFDGMRIVFLSDLHLQPFFGPDRLAPVLALVQAEKPDLILLGGDYCNETLGNREYWLELCADTLRTLTAPLGVFAVFGNHDYPVPPFDPPRRPWEEAKINPLHDEAVSLSRNGERIFLVGLRSTLSRRNQVRSVMEKLPADTTRLILQHEPSFTSQNAALGGSVQLSGHTHGGQIVLPFFGAPRLPAHSSGFRAGLYQTERGQMPVYVTRGVGVLPPLLRFNCLPEVTLITLRHSGVQVTRPPGVREEGGK